MKKNIYSVVLLIILFLIINIFHSYLSLNNPISADILLVEGWINYNYAPKILEELQRHHYSRIVVVGIIKPKINRNYIDYIQENALQITTRLRALTDNTTVITLINSIYVNKHQTFNYMVFFKNWLKRELPNIKSVNLFSVGVHARKSHLILRRVLPTSIKTGVISTAPIYYNAEYWWLSKRGVWLFIKNTISFIYAFVFENCQTLAC